MFSNLARTVFTLTFYFVLWILFLDLMVVASWFAQIRLMETGLISPPDIPPALWTP